MGPQNPGSGVHPAGGGDQGGDTCLCPSFGVPLPQGLRCSCPDFRGCLGLIVGILPRILGLSRPRCWGAPVLEIRHPCPEFWGAPAWIFGVAVPGPFCPTFGSPAPNVGVVLTRTLGAPDPDFGRFLSRILGCPWCRFWGSRPLTWGPLPHFIVPQMHKRERTCKDYIKVRGRGRQGVWPRAMGGAFVGVVRVGWAGLSGWA